MCILFVTSSISCSHLLTGSAIRQLFALFWFLAETKPKWFVFETSCYHAFGGRIHCFAKANVNKVNIIVYWIVLILVASCSFLCTLSLYWQYLRLSAQRNSVTKMILFILLTFNMETRQRTAVANINCVPKRSFFYQDIELCKS